jgi:Flp pilus assembly protein TadG
MFSGQRKKRRSTGQAIVEFCLIFPVALWLLVGAVDFGRFVISHSEAAALCQDAARYGRQVDPETGNQRSEEAIQERIWSSMPSGVTSSDIETLDIQMNTTIGGLNATKISIVYNTPCLMPFSNRIFDDGVMKIRGKGVFVRDM